MSVCFLLLFRDFYVSGDKMFSLRKLLDGIEADKGFTMEEKGTTCSNLLFPNHLFCGFNLLSLIKKMLISGVHVPVYKYGHQADKFLLKFAK